MKTCESPPRLLWLRPGSVEAVLSRADLRALDPALTQDKHLCELVMPAIRTDYRLTETYQPTRPPRVAAPLLACFGASDTGVDAASAKRWDELTRDFPGGRFCPDESLPELTAEIAQHMESARPAHPEN